MNPTLEIPARIKKLQRNEKGYPVPWFVQWIDGKPDFRVMDGDKWRAAIEYKLCWICGEGMGKFKAFVIGPMCAVNRTSGEPPSHRECAEYAAKACPFLVEPKRVRREKGLPEGDCVGGISLARNPGVALVWITASYEVFPVKAEPGVAGGYLIELGDPIEVLWYAEGREATRGEVMASIESGLPLLETEAKKESQEAMDQLGKQYRAALELDLQRTALCRNRRLPGLEPKPSRLRRVWRGSGFPNRSAIENGGGML